MRNLRLFLVGILTVGLPAAEATLFSSQCSRELQVDPERTRVKQELLVARSASQIYQVLSMPKQGLRWYSNRELRDRNDFALDNSFFARGGLVGLTVVGVVHQRRPQDPMRRFVGRVASGSELVESGEIELTLEDSTSYRLRLANADEFWVLGETISDEDLMYAILKRQSIPQRLDGLFHDLSAEDFVLFQAIIDLLYQVPIDEVDHPEVVVARALRAADDKFSANEFYGFQWRVNLGRHRFPSAQLVQLIQFTHNLLVSSVGTSDGSAQPYRYSAEAWKKALCRLAHDEGLALEVTLAPVAPNLRERERIAKDYLAATPIFSKLALARESLVSQNVFQKYPMRDSLKASKAFEPSDEVGATYDPARKIWTTGYAMPHFLMRREVPVGSKKIHSVVMDLRLIVEQTSDGTVVGVTSQWSVCGAIAPSADSNETFRPLWKSVLVDAAYLLDADSWSNMSLNPLIDRVRTLGLDE